MGKSSYQPLSESERTYLQTGETGSYTESKLRDNIRDKQMDIGHRLNQLADELSLMRRSEYFEYSAVEIDLFEDLSIYKTSNLAFDNEIRAEPKNSIIGFEPDGVRLDPPRSAPEFGYYMGGLLTMLLELVPEEHSWDKTLQGLVMFYLFVLNEEPKDKLNKLSDLADFDYVDHQQDGYFARGCSGDWNYRIKSGYSKYEDNTKEIEFLQNKEVPSSEALCRVLRFPVDDESFQEYPSATELFEKNFTKLQKVELFNKTIKLNKTIISDIEYLEQPFKGPNRLDILDQMRSATQKKNSNNIAKGVGKPSQDNLVESALNKMSIECENNNLWTTHPVVKESNGEWNFTPYGALLAEYAGGDITNNEFARHGLPEEDNQYDLISAALAYINKSDE